MADASTDPGAGAPDAQGPLAPRADARDQEQTRALLERREEPDARDALVRLHQPLVTYLARRFAGRGEPLEDLVQVANIGLLKSISRFDLERGVAFSTFATPTIIGELKRHFRDRGWALHVPRSLQELGLRTRDIAGSLHQELGRSPTIAEIAARARVTEEAVLEALDAMQAYSTSSLESPEDEEGHDIRRTLGADDPSIELMVRWQSVSGAIRALPDRERRILGLRFVQGMTQGEIATEIGLSQMHVSRLLARTLETLRGATTADDKS